MKSLEGLINFLKSRRACPVTCDPWNMWFQIKKQNNTNLLWTKIRGCDVNTRRKWNLWSLFHRQSWRCLIRGKKKQLSSPNSGSTFLTILLTIVMTNPYIQKGGSRGSRTPQTILNFPQKDCLRTRKVSRLHCFQSYWLPFPLFMFSHCLTCQ